jgi:uncharacterized membrane protein
MLGEPEMVNSRKCMALMGCRFHAWQSALLFSAIFVLHLIFSWSTFLSWLMFVGDLGLIGLLTFHAYRDGEYCSLSAEK